MREATDFATTTASDRAQTKRTTCQLLNLAMAFDWLKSVAQSVGCEMGQSTLVRFEKLSNTV